jgi:hypothetical protein
MNEFDHDFDFLFEVKLVSSFLGRLGTLKRKRIPRKEIWSAFSETYSQLPEGVEQRRCLMTLLNELEASGEVKLPVRHGKSWDRSSNVATPSWLDIPQEQKRRSTEWRSYPWHPQLQWVLERTQLSAEQFQFLKQVQKGLVGNWYSQLAPLKYRSLQLTGDEKKLISLCKSQLFGEGRLSFSMLGCDPEILPMVIERVGDESSLLIFENAAPYMVARRALLSMDSKPVGHIAYGSGHQVSKSIEYLQFFTPRITQILYVGDLDSRGIYIASKLQRLASANGLPTVLPASTIHRQMLTAAAELNSPNGWPDNSEPAKASGDWIFDFLAEDSRDSVRKIVESRRRIPEEVIHEQAMLTCFEIWR